MWILRSKVEVYFLEFIAKKITVLLALTRFSSKNYCVWILWSENDVVKMKIFTKIWFEKIQNQHIKYEDTVLEHANHIYVLIWCHFSQIFSWFFDKNDKKNAQNQIMYTFFQKIIRRLQFSNLFWYVFFFATKIMILFMKCIFWKVTFSEQYIESTILIFFCFFLKKTYHFRPSNTNMKIFFWKFCIMFTIVKIRFFKPKKIIFC